MSGGLNFSDSFSSDYASNNKSTFRKAGDAFSVGSGNNITNSTTNNRSSSKSKYDTWLSYMGNQNNQSSNQSQSSSSSGVSGWTPKAEQPANTLENNSDTKPASTPEAPTYNEADYRYYVSDFGTGTGAEAYAQDMENYNNQHETIKGMPHVHMLFHPDWGASQKAGGPRGVEEQDYSRPNERYERRTRNKRDTLSKY